MARSVNQKLKMFYILKYLSEETDENHMVTNKDIIAYLDKYDITAERKSIYDDINQLIDYGYDIAKPADRTGGYYMQSREFELAELKILVDLVQSSKFITVKKSQELIKKLETLASQYEAKQLNRQVVVSDRNKTINEKIFYNVDILYRAMSQNEKVRFHYFEWDENKRMAIRKEGQFYEVSPWFLTWDDEKYYLMAFDENDGIIKNYRVDKMVDLDLTGLVRRGKAAADKIDVTAISKKSFGMFAGDEVTIQLKFLKSKVGIIVDRFGTDVAIRPYEADDNYLLARMNVQVSPQFFGWLTGLGKGIEIYSPDAVREKYVEHLKKLLEQYNSI